MTIYSRDQKYGKVFFHTFENLLNEANTNAIEATSSFVIIVSSFADKGKR
mgnify:CR=1 FL=1